MNALQESMKSIAETPPELLRGFSLFERAAIIAIQRLYEAEMQKEKNAAKTDQSSAAGIYNETIIPETI